MEFIFDLLTGQRRLKSDHVIDSAQFSSESVENQLSQNSASNNKEFHYAFLEETNNDASLQSRINSALKAAGIEASPIQLFEAINGFTISVSPAEAERLEAIPTIRSIEADRPLPLTPPVEVIPETNNSANESSFFSESGSTPGWREIDRAVSLDQYYVKTKISTSKEELRPKAVSATALPIYNNGSASTGEILPYGVKAVWGGSDISTQGNAGTGTYAFVIDSGVLDTTGDLIVNRTWSKSWVSGETAFTDGNGHGTHVAGTIAALANGIGVVGVAPGAEVISLKVFNRYGGGASYSTIIDAVNYATQVINNNGLDKSKVVINMSLGGGYSAGMDAAVKNAANQGIKFAIAAGNSGSDADDYSPASAGDHANIYTVSAVDNQYRMSSWSNWDDQSGGDDVDVAAPGVSVLSYYKGGQLANLSGTSMAAPHVAGLLLMGGVTEGDMVTANWAGEADPFALASNGQPSPPTPPPAPIKPPTEGLIDDFSGGQTSSFWKSISLGSINNNFTGRSESLFFTGSGTRSATTKTIDLDQGATISFDLVYGTDFNGGEEVDSGEEVVLEYSSDGSSWNILKSFDISSSTRSWGNHSASLSAALATDSTQFRWRQKAHSSSNWDEWAIDDVAITGTPKLSSIENQGSVELLVDSFGKSWVKTSADTFRLHRNGWGDGVTQDRGFWKVSGAETINGTNYALDRSEDRVYVWEMDSNWNFIRDAQTATPSETAYYQIESTFGLDLNNDGLTGTPKLSSIENQGSVELLVDSFGKSWVKTSADTFRLHRNGWGDGVTQDRGFWKVSGAETINGTNYALDRSEDRVYVWEMDSNWNFIRDAQTATPSETAYYQIESTFGLDLNNDGLTGTPKLSSIENQGSVELLVDSFGKSWVKTSADTFRLHRNGWGDGVTQDRGFWKVSGAETINGTNYALDRSEDRVYVWEMDSNWNFIRDAQTATPSETAYYQIESTFGLDLNNDGLTGTPKLSSIENQGSVELLVDSFGKSWVKTSADTFRLHRNGWGDGVTQDRGFWKVSGAETINGTNYALDRSEDRVYVWEMDSNWNFIRDAQTATPSETAYYQIESTFGLDLNNDGLTGTPKLSSIENQGSVELLVDSFGKSWVKTSADTFRLHRNGWGDGVTQDRGFWKVSGAETINGTNYALDRSEDRVYVWEMDSNWNFIRDAQTATPSETAYYQIESTFGLDLNNDGLTGTPKLSSIENQGSVELLVDSFGKSWVKTSADTFRLHRNGWGDGVTQDRGFWKVSGAETINGTNYALDRSEDRVYVWEMDSNWNFIRDAQTATPSETAYYQIESTFGLDLNNDGLIFQ